MSQLQLIFDHGTRDEVLACVANLADHVDIVEIGYPELVTYGLDIVREIHETHPQLKICVDAKVFHGGSGVTRRCFEAGASIVTVLASAPDEVIQQMVIHARTFGGEIMCDMDGVRNVGRRTVDVEVMGVQYVQISSGYLMEHEYDINKPQRNSIFQMRPLEKARTVKRNLMHAGLALGTGINERNIDEIMALSPEIVMIGRGILAVDGAYSTTPERQVEAADAVREHMSRG
jgi:3-hexulose-6-phosphate synthase